MIRRFASYALLAAVAFAAAGCGAARARVVAASRSAGGPAHLVRDVGHENRIGPGPFVPAGGWTGGGGSGLWGDGSTGPAGTSLGCIDNRHYSYAFGMKNTLKVPVTLISALGPNPAPPIVDRVATQLVLSPPQRPRSSTVLNWGGGDGLDLVYRGWSAAPTKPVRIPPHRIATVQINFLMQRCATLTAGRRVTIPGSLLLRYRTSGHSGRQVLVLPENGIVVVPGPKKRTCTPVPGSAGLVTANVGCAFARRAAPACRAMKNGGWLGCTIEGRPWECGRFAGAGYPLLETCYLPQKKSHWFRVVWVGGGLGIWGAIQDRRWNRGWRRIDAWRATRGICTDRPAGGPFVFESSALRILPGKAAAREFSDVRVKFVVRNFRGPGSVSARGVVEVELQRHGARRGSYVATAGRLTIARTTKRGIAGTVFASLRESGGTKRASLNGTWSCRTTVG